MASAPAFPPLGAIQKALIVAGWLFTAAAGLVILEGFLVLVLTSAMTGSSEGIAWTGGILVLAAVNLWKAAGQARRIFEVSQHLAAWAWAMAGGGMLACAIAFFTLFTGPRPHMGLFMLGLAFVSVAILLGRPRARNIYAPITPTRADIADEKERRAQVRGPYQRYLELGAVVTVCLVCLGVPRLATLMAENGIRSPARFLQAAQRDARARQGDLSLLIGFLPGLAALIALVLPLFVVRRATATSTTLRRKVPLASLIHVLDEIRARMPEAGMAEPDAPRRLGSNDYAGTFCGRNSCVDVAVTQDRDSAEIALTASPVGVILDTGESRELAQLASYLMNGGARPLSVQFERYSLMAFATSIAAVLVTMALSWSPTPSSSMFAAGIALALSAASIAVCLFLYPNRVGRRYSLFAVLIALVSAGIALATPLPPGL